MHSRDSILRRRWSYGALRRYLASQRLFNAAMLEAGLPAPGLRDAGTHYDMGQSPHTALAEALAGNL